MVTLEQLYEGVVRLDAMGDIEGVRALGEEIVRRRQQSSGGVKQEQSPEVSAAPATMVQTEPQAPIMSGGQMPEPQMVNLMASGGGIDSGERSQTQQMIGGVLRGAGDIGAGALAGGMMAGPPGALAGAAAVALTNPTISLINNLFGTNYTRPEEAMQHLLTQIGVPKADTEAARMVQAMSRGAAEGVAQVGVGKALQMAASPVVRGVGETLASQPAQQIAGSAGAAGGAQAAQEMGLGAVGQVAGALAGGALGSTFTAEKQLASAAMPKGVSEAEQIGVTPLTSQVFQSKTPLGNALAKMREITFMGTGSLLAKQEVGRKKAIETLVEDFGANLPGVDYLPQLTEALTSRRRDIVNKFSAMKSNVIDKLSSAGKDVNVDNTLKVVGDEISRLKGISGTGYDKAVAELESFGMDIIGKDLKNIEARRKLLGLQFKAPELATVSEEGDRSVRRIYDSLRADMGDFIQSEGSRSDYIKWKVGNKNLSEMSDELRDSTLKLVLNKGDISPERVRDMLFSQNKSTIQRLYDNLDKTGRETAERAVIRKAVDRSGGLDGFTPNKFLSEIKKMEDETGIIFRGEKKQRIDGLTKALELTKRAGEFAVNTPTGVQLVPFGVATMLGQYLGVAGTAVGAAAMTAGVRAYESKPVRDILIKLSRENDGYKQQLLMRRLSEVIKSQQAKTSEPSQESEK